METILKTVNAELLSFGGLTVLTCPNGKVGSCFIEPLSTLPSSSSLIILHVCLTFSWTRPAPGTDMGYKGQQKKLGFLI